MWESDFEKWEARSEKSIMREVILKSVRSEKAIMWEVRKRLCEKWFWEVLLWKMLLRYEEDDTGFSKFWVIKFNLFLIC
jgi:hypothetical protein